MDNFEGKKIKEFLEPLKAIPKGRSIVYATAFVIGLATIIVFGVFKTNISDSYFTIFISIGTSIVSSIFLSFLIDFANESREIKKRKEFRSYYLDGLSNSWFNICYKIIACYCSTHKSEAKSINNKSVYEASLFASQEFQKYSPSNQLDESEIESQSRQYQDLIVKISNSISDFSNFLKPIVNLKIYLISIGMISNEDFLHLQYLNDELSKISNSHQITCFKDFGEKYYEMVIMANKVKEISAFTSKKLTIHENGKLGYVNAINKH